MRNLVAVLVLAVVFAGCTIPDFGQQGGSQGPGQAQTPPPAACGIIKVATFNIQTFGQSKMNDTGVAGRLVQILQRYDVIAVQEIRDSSGDAFPALIEKLNAAGSAHYDYVISPRLGRTSSKEQYAFIYNTATVSYAASTVFNDSAFERPPFAAEFSARDFGFVLVNIHTKPEKGYTILEISNLSAAVKAAKQAFAGEPDVVVLGDYNADCSYVSVAELDASPLRASGFFWVVGDANDTTVRDSTDCAYDRIVMTNATRPAYSGAWGIFRFDAEFGLNESAALDVSDHYPVWAEFRGC
jgi:endonuclease/exonuclease/phosphatase family metal-dependent hydrolase